MFHYCWTFRVFCPHWNHHWFYRFLCSSWVVGVLQHPANTVLWGDFFPTCITWWVRWALWFFVLQLLFLFQFGAALLIVACVFAIRALCVLIGVYAIEQQIVITGRC